MAKRETFGGRWIRDNKAEEGKGGQGQVYRVRDSFVNTGEFFAMKRVTNIDRRERFKTEIESIKRLDHPNIIKIIDHSTLDDKGDGAREQYIVMPLALGRTLADRKSQYKGNINATLKIALLLAEALYAAHSVNVIHRDVKPANILFKDESDDVWLADFGIALMLDMPRHTGNDEIVGPAHFIAPELERGGQQDVKPSADIYSLGKVIYYILSGGVIIRREALNDPFHAKIFDKGEEYLQLNGLLSRMICDVSSRITTMKEVIEEIQRIREVPSRALLPFAKETFQVLDQLRMRNISDREGKEKNAQIIADRNDLSKLAISTISAAISSRLETLAEQVADSNGITAGVKNTREAEDSPTFAEVRAFAGVEIWVVNRYEAYPTKHVLRFSLCRPIRFDTLNFDRGPKALATEDRFETIAVIPTYKTDIPEDLHKSMTWHHFDMEGMTYFPKEFPGRPFLHVNVETRNSTHSTEQISSLVLDCVHVFMKKLAYLAN